MKRKEFYYFKYQLRQLLFLQDGKTIFMVETENHLAHYQLRNKIEFVVRKEKIGPNKLFSNATINCLDKDAIRIAREKYKEKMNRPHTTDEVNNMTDEEFFNQN